MLQGRVWRFAVKAAVFAVLVFVLTAAVWSPVHAASDVILTPGQTYDVSSAGNNTTVYIDAPGGYTLKGESDTVRVMIRCGGVTVCLADGLSITPGAFANAGVRTAAITVEDMGGDVKLVSCKNAEIDLEGYMAPAIRKAGENTRLIFETEDASEPGTIRAVAGAASAAIGGDAWELTRPEEYYTGNITINSGNIFAYGAGGSAGIGCGPVPADYVVRNIVINGGYVHAEGSNEGGAGIGGGYQASVNGIYINGGQVTAYGKGGAGIGSGSDSKFAINIRITGGTIYAESLMNLGAGIGGGDESEVRGLRIEGGNVTAKGGVGIGAAGAEFNGTAKSIHISGGNIWAHGTQTGIGSSNHGTDTTQINISGGVIEAVSDNGAAIGGGGFSSLLDGDQITNVHISGGTVYARGKTYDIGGSALWTDECNITITGGSIDAEKLHAVPVDAKDNAVYCTTITLEDDTSTWIHSAEIAGRLADYPAYGLKDVKSDDENKLYFWLPEGNRVTTLSGGPAYVGDVPAGASGTMTLCTRILIYDRISDDYGQAYVYKGRDSIFNITLPERPEGYLLEGFGDRWDTPMARADGKLFPDLSTYTDENGCWVMDYNLNTRMYTINVPIEYTLHFDANGGTGDMADVICTYDEETTLPENGFTRQGYTFVGWKLDENTTFQNGDTVKNLTAEQDSTVTLTAIWQADAPTEPNDPADDPDDPADTPDDPSIPDDDHPKTGDRGVGIWALVFATSFVCGAYVLTAQRRR